MSSFRTLAIALASALMASLSWVTPSAAQASPAAKINAYVGCINRLSERSYSSRQRYFSWAAKSGPTGKERIIYGLYTIYETTDCKQNVEKANALEPREAELEAAATAYVEAVAVLEPLLKEADDYYTQENYKDDKMAKGRALHPRLVAAWAAFATADEKLRAGIDILQDTQVVQKLAAIEKEQGRKGRWHVEHLMMRAKRLMRIQSADPPKLPLVTEAVGEYEAAVKATEEFAAANKDSKIGASYVGSAKTLLTTAKQLMRRVRDKVPYSSGEKMLINGSGAWMVEGSPARLTRDYNQLIESYNRGASF